jgi:hypothetical protein
MRQQVDSVFDGAAICEAETKDWSGAELIEWSRTERVLGGERRQIACLGQFDDDFAGDKLFAVAVGVRNAIDRRPCE